MRCSTEINTEATTGNERNQWDFFQTVNGLFPTLVTISRAMECSLSLVSQ